MTQIATTIEQSNKLIELGLSADTADMNYCNSSYKGKDYVGEWKLSLQSPQEAKNILDMSVTSWNTYWEIIPAWSLSKLIDMVPEGTLLSIYRHEGKYWFISNEPLKFSNPPIRRTECYDNMIELILNEFIYPKFENPKSEEEQIKELAELKNELLNGIK